MRLLFNIGHESVAEISGRVFKREAVRAIVLRGQDILLLYTKRYNDYSLPGGGIDSGEELLTALKRELSEETGARNVKVIGEFGYIDEYRPHYRSEYDFMHMLSYVYVCEIDADLGPASMEHYELANGMEVVWMNLFEAIEHNQAVMAANESSMGLSIARETRILELVAKELVTVETV